MFVFVLFSENIQPFFPTSISSPEQSAHILQEIGRKIQSYPFNYQGAAILSGQQEGAYGWVTVNYLLENFIKVLKLFLKCFGRFQSAGFYLFIYIFFCHFNRTEGDI